MKYPIAILILAAGKASRMGQPKQLLPYRGTTLLGHCIQTALQCPVEAVYPILGAYADQIQNNIQTEGFQWLFNPDWEEGLSASIRQGVTFLSNYRPQIQAALVMLGDQPLITAEDLMPFFEAFRQNPQGIVSTAYGEKYGVPALFPRSYFAELSQLEGDRGAGKWMAAQKNVMRIQLTSTFDVDTQDDYQQIQ